MSFSHITESARDAFPELPEDPMDYEDSHELEDNTYMHLSSDSSSSGK